MVKKILAALTNLFTPRNMVSDQYLKAHGLTRTDSDGINPAGTGMDANNPESLGNSVSGFGPMNRR